MHGPGVTVDLDTDPDFKPYILAGKRLVVIPSQGVPGTNILTGQEGEMLFEHRQEVEALGGIFVSRSRIPIAEDEYRQELFGDRRPHWHIPAQLQKGKSLDALVLNDPVLIQQLRSAAAGKNYMLYGYHETEHMHRIAELIRIPYYGNKAFAQWAGSKIGMQQFAHECGIYTPHTYALREPVELIVAAQKLQSLGYESLVIKVNHSTGGMGHAHASIPQVITACEQNRHTAVLPPEFTQEEGAVVQGWIEPHWQEALASIDITVDLSGAYHLMYAKVKSMDATHLFAATGYLPVNKSRLTALKQIGHRLGKGYARHAAYGPHCANVIFLTQAGSQRLGLPYGEPLYHDENTRVGAGKIAHAWASHARGGSAGAGWVFRNISVPANSTFAHVLDLLGKKKLLVTQAGPDAHGIVPYGGSPLDHGHHNTFHAVAVSHNNDPSEATDMMNQAAAIFCPARGR